MNFQTPLSNLDSPIPHIKALPQLTKTIRIHPFHADKNNNKIRKERLNRIHKISLEYHFPNKYLQASQFRKLASNLKQLKHLSCLKIDLYSLTLNNVKAIPALFESLKHFKTPFKILFCPVLTSSHMQSKLDHQVLLTLCQSIKNLQNSPHMTIELIFRIRNDVLEASARKLLKTLANHTCFTCLHLEMSHFGCLPELKRIINALKSSKSLSRIDLTLDCFRFGSPTQSKSLFRKFGKLKSVKSLQVHFKCCNISFGSLKGAASGLKENTQIRDLQLLFEEGGGTQIKISKVEWWLAMRSLRKGTRSQKVQTQSKHLVLVSPKHLGFVILMIILVYAIIKFLSYIRSII